MIYAIRLTITHHYGQPAANGRHVIRVAPATLLGRQHLTTSLLDISPAPDSRADGTDFFGNRTVTCAHKAPHGDMSIQLTGHVEVTTPPPWHDRSPNLETLVGQWQQGRSLDPEAPLHFLGPTRRLTPDRAITAFAADIYDPGGSVAANVIAIGEALHRALTFDATATTVETDAAEAFQLRRGVCQDFTHIMILALQALGIPAAYVSGYLRTLPPEGGARLAGADAMHAWVRAWCGVEQGWIEYDPTNATLVGADHIVVGYGRDYTDIAPVSGYLRASGTQRNTQAVDVTVLR
jgi:transglutaminase-like putative cysteine protease